MTVNHRFQFTGRTFIALSTMTLASISAFACGDKESDNDEGVPPATGGMTSGPEGGAPPEATGGTGGTAVGTGGDTSTGGGEALDLSVCDAPGWADALAHADNVVVPAKFADGERLVLAEYDLAPVTVADLEAEHSLVVVVAPAADADPRADFETDGLDDEVQINAATKQVYEAGGGVIFLKAGTYNVGDSVYIWDESLLRGEGRIGERRTMIHLQDDAPSMSGESGIVRIKKDSKFGFAGLGKRVMNSGLSDLVIDGNRDNQATLEAPAKPDDEKKYGYYAEGEDIWVQRVTVQNCLGYGFDPHEHEDIIGSTVTITDCYSTNNLNDGFTLDAIHDVVIAHNVSYANNRHGFNIVTGTERIALCGNVAYENGWTADAVPVAKANGITAQNGSDPETPIPNALNMFDNSVTNNAKVGFDLRMTYDSALTANYVGDNGSHGIRVRGAQDNTIESNLVEFDSQDSGTAYEIWVGDYDQDDSVLTPSLPSQGNTISGNTLKNVDARYVHEETESLGLNTISGNTESTN